MNDLQLLKKIKEDIKKNPYYHQIKNKHDKEDIVHKTFMYIWKKIKNNEISDDYDDIQDYIFISTRNNCLLYLRRIQRERSRYVYGDTYNDKYGTSNEVENDTFIQEKINYIKSLLIYDIDKQIIDLRLEGYTFKEISDILNIDINKVHNINKTLVRFIRNKIQNSNIRRYPPSILNKKYKVINTDTKEIVYQCLYISQLSNKYNIKERYIKDNLLNGSKVFNKNLRIEIEYFKNNGRKIELFEKL